MRALLPGLCVVLCACGGGNGDDTGDFDTIEIEPAVATLSIPLGGTASQDFAVYGVAGGRRTEITADCALSVDASFGKFSGATLAVLPRGGKTPVLATCGAQSGQGVLVVNLTGSIVIGSAPANAQEIFGQATAGTDAARAPTIQYPIDRAVSPRNIPSIEMQWTAAANDLFHVALTSSFASVDVYTTAVEALLDERDWTSIAQTAAGDMLAITVEGVQQGAPDTKFTGAPVAIAMSNDDIDKTAIYYWASSQGNIMSQTFGLPEPPSLVKDDCTSCHSVSRSGSRIGYSRCVAGDCGQLFAGFLRYDANTRTWVERVNANDRAIAASYSTFAPVGNPFPTDEQSLAMLTMSNGTLALYDPDTGAPVPSNLAVANGPGGGRAALMADWSADGNKVVFASTPYPGQFIDLSDGTIQTMTYSYLGGQHVFGEPQTIVPNPINLPNGTYTNFFFPSFSPDGQLVVFDAARSGWRNGGDARAPGQRLMLADANGAWVTDLPALNGGYADLDITWAHWAPTVSNDYYWIVFSSERDYGHRTTAATSPPSCVANGVRQCKQIWLGAIAKNKLSNGTMDPSAPPMWLPGQNPLANNISPYWSVPASIQ
ncbi:MAG: TolB family protein [Kofleriaceae bacterium]